MDKPEKMEKRVVFPYNPKSRTWEHAVRWEHTDSAPDETSPGHGKKPAKAILIWTIAPVHPRFVSVEISGINPTGSFVAIHQGGDKFHATGTPPVTQERLRSMMAELVFTKRLDLGLPHPKNRNYAEIARIREWVMGELRREYGPAKKVRRLTRKDPPILPERCTENGG